MYEVKYSRSAEKYDFFGYDVMYSGINYEIAYQIYEENNKLVVIILAGTRENFYRELKRLIRRTP